VRWQRLVPPQSSQSGSSQESCDCNCPIALFGPKTREKTEHNQANAKHELWQFGETYLSTPFRLLSISLCFALDHIKIA
jgi:hypothetical protein